MKKFFSFLLIAFISVVSFNTLEAKTVEGKLGGRYSYSYTVSTGQVDFVIIDDIDGNITSLSVVAATNAIVTSSGVSSNDGFVITDEIDGTFTLSLLIDGTDSFVIIDDIDGTFDQSKAFYLPEMEGMPVQDNGTTEQIYLQKATEELPVARWLRKE